MGNDGGSIPKRRELVKSPPRNPTVSQLKATALESLTHAWTHDALTSEPLTLESVVSDWRGRLYNYETVLEKLMPSDDSNNNDDDNTTPATANGESKELNFASTGIKSLRDVVKLKFKRYSPPGEKGREIWACPLSLKELGPATKAVYLVPCGHVFAEVSIKTIQEELCPECSESFESDNVIDILPTEQSDMERLSKRMDGLVASGLTHSLRKDKSQGKKKRKADDAKQEGRKSEKRKNGEGLAKPSKGAIDSRVSGINNPMTASLTAKVLAEQDAANKRRKLAADR
ncbi:Rtf2 RING-finger-domain-containing protein [Phialemonium atrogriseum]|uniref:Rtf2 RING-finger-domain-containing protein n=1 Tax=Phialemonium atrogriseum TaxID=1093897 RepID=A0AAJ0FM09_9PEZI|nr:Rtf2 RING-finger-domain-containing protein [Phialemonium atrogriseum]KAK1767878.1 Rtf2 RING-finger-domain-containing protein [Phialemonium atrogriseum]